ncbi:MAG: PASTA domain-containing protein [Actinomycetota bacterium]|nr:PASTA domain-containing protein [Actinomycetota bacterium]
MAQPPYPPEPGDTDDATIADEEWPVAEQYRVQPRSRPPEEDDGAIVIHQDTAPQGPVRRFPPDLGPGLLLALLGIVLIVVLVPAGIWLAGRDDDESAATPTTGTLETTTSSTTTTTTPTTTSPDASTVPEVTGLTLDEARALLAASNVRARVRRVSSNGPAGEVLEQSPEPGARLTADTVVILTVSKAPVPERVTVPPVGGLLASEAASLLRQAGLDAEIDTVRSSEPEGTVVGQRPKPGKEVAPRTIVALEVAGPPEPVTVEVPRLVGVRAAEARSQLQELGLRVTQRPVESTQPKGTVVRQSPGPGTKLQEGQAVLLAISTGPARVSVPDVVGLDEEAAREQLETAGFAVQIVDEPTETVEEDGIVVGQEPAGGSSTPKGSIVSITVSRFG